MTTTNATHQRDHWAVSLSQGMTGWVLGTGMLAFHAGLFFLMMTGFTLWNLTQSPDDLWVTSLLRRWGAVIVFHAIAVAAGWAAYRLMKVPVHSVIDVAPSAPPAGGPGPQIVPPGSSNGNGRGSGPWNVGAEAGDQPDQPIRLSAAERAAQWPGTRPRIAPNQEPAPQPEDVVIETRMSGDDPSPPMATDEPIVATPSPVNQRWSWVEAAAGTWLGHRDSAEDGNPESRPASDDAASPS